MTPPPLHFVFGIHLHQPVGNLDSVFEDHVDHVYLPLLRHLGERELGPVLLHLSGPLFGWLETRAHPLLDLVGRLADQQQVELLSSGHDEPILAALDPADRLEQIARMRAYLKRRFGQDGRTMWLTERVWEPSLAGDLAEAGIETVLVDDRHLHLAGLGPDATHRPWRTEDRGHGVWVLGIDERLRYLVPFRPPEAFAEQVRAFRRDGHHLAVLADDGEKFGGWPGTRRRVWDEGWMEGFTDQLEAMREKGELELVRTADLTARHEPGGLVYLPTASYREMEAWTLPPDAEGHRAAAEAKLAGASAEERVWVRGGHWRGFLARYAESNRMHKKAADLSRLCRLAGDPPEVRLAVGRAQCNDAYWHGVFGGLYVRPLRQAVWRNLARAEALLRVGQPLTVELADTDGDGRPEVRIHSEHMSAVVAPHRGGALEELTLFEPEANLLDVLTRRPEAYHRSAVRGDDPISPDDGSDGQHSIHEREDAFRLDKLPPVDPLDRLAFVEAVIGSSPEHFPGRIEPEAVGAPWWSATFRVRTRVTAEMAEITLEAEAPSPWLVKRYRFDARGLVEVQLTWDPLAFDRGDHFVCAISMAWPAHVTCDPDPVTERTEIIRTLSRTEEGWAHEDQGSTLTLAWPAETGQVAIQLDAGHRAGPEVRTPHPIDSPTGVRAP
jgi:4-alpha-glucanotransferase